MKGKLQAGLSLLCLLSAAILATIYLAWLLYPLEIDFLGLESVVYMKKADILTNFHILMRYLTLPWVTELAMPSFSSSADGLHHFQDVKQLFHIAQGIFLLTVPALFAFYNKVVKRGYGSLYRNGFIRAALVPVVVLIAGVVLGFDQFFTLFHQVLFPGDSTWLFNPNTDPVIYILPQEFFLHCFVLFFVLYEGMVGGMVFLCSAKRGR